MPRVSPDAKCAHCGGEQSDVGPLSYRHICKRCGAMRAVANAVQIGSKSGPLYLRHLDGQRRRLERDIAAA